MENALKGLLMAAGTILTCMVIAFGFRAADVAKATAAEITGEMEVQERRLHESNYLAYDGAVISGSELVNFLRFELNRKNNGENSLAYFEISDISTVRLSTVNEVKSLTLNGTAGYVPPNGAYKGRAVWQQGTLLALSFTRVRE